jgi:hypothetical protein
VSILASVVPGLRDVRGPLVAGYLWLLVAWLIVDPDPKFRDASGALRAVVNLAHAIGPFATAIAVSVAAYLIGAVSHVFSGVAASLIGALAPHVAGTRIGRWLGLRAPARTGQRQPAALRAAEDEENEVRALLDAVPEAINAVTLSGPEDEDWKWVRGGPSRIASSIRVHSYTRATRTRAAYYRVGYFLGGPPADMRRRSLGGPVPQVNEALEVARTTLRELEAHWSAGRGLRVRSG